MRKYDNPTHDFLALYIKEGAEEWPCPKEDPNRIQLMHKHLDDIEQCEREAFDQLDNRRRYYG